MLLWDVLPQSDQPKAGPALRDTPGPGHLGAAATGHPAADSDSGLPGRQPAGGIRRVPRRGPPQAARLLIIVQNLPVPFDRRVWLECQALASAGYRVAVVCPKGRDDPAYEVIDSVELYKYRPYAPGGSKVSFIAEYAYSFLATAWGMVKARRSGRFAVIQACNPPDIFWPLALAFRALEGTRFVFDHHDLCPELFLSRFPRGPKLPYRGLLALERRTHRTANHVIATNDSYREIAMTRGGKRADEVTVVRTGPDLRRLRPGEPDLELRRGGRFLAAYIGVMGPQDGVDIAIRAADIVVNKLGRNDIAFTLIGSGDCFHDLVALRDELGLAGHVEFTGRAPDELVARIMSTADVGLSPDPKNPLNDVSTMNKTMEYMAFGLPVVAFDLRETRVSAGDAAVYAPPNDEQRYAEAIVALLDDEPRRAQMGKLARERVEQELAWDHQESAYLGVYERVLSRVKARKRMKA
jgi:glycosyltransferase involved in cell wall biosynthesis